MLITTQWEKPQKRFDLDSKDYDIQVGCFVTKHRKRKYYFKIINKENFRIHKTGYFNQQIEFKFIDCTVTWDRYSNLQQTVLPSK